MAHLSNIPFLGSDNIIVYLNIFAFRLRVKYPDTINSKVNILIVGGSALALKYGVRRTVDIDADIKFSKAIKSLIIDIAVNNNIPSDWLNQDFIKSNSYSKRLWDKALYYTTLCEYMNVYVVNDLDQLCMKAVSGRKKDYTDIKLLLNNLVQSGCTFEDFNNDFYYLYGDNIKTNQRALKMIKRILR